MLEFSEKQQALSPENHYWAALVQTYKITQLALPTFEREVPDEEN
jgi:hypothetical protein